MPRRRSAVTTEELAARTMRILAKSPGSYFADAYYHASLDLLADRAVRRLTGMHRSLMKAVEAEERAAEALHYLRTTDLVGVMLDTSATLASLRPALEDLCDLVSELKEALKFLADAEEFMAPSVKAEAEDRAVDFTVQLLSHLSSVDPATLQTIDSVVELILDTGVMLSARPSCCAIFREMGGLQVMVNLLDSQDYAPVLERGCVIVANLSESALNRYDLRLAGVMPVLVSLLDDCMLDGVRVAAATAVSMMCCTDGPCQDALRFADGLPLLVRMANSVNMKVAKVAKLAVQCACEANAKNSAAVARVLRIEQIKSDGGFGRAAHLLGQVTNLLDEDSYKTYAPSPSMSSRRYSPRTPERRSVYDRSRGRSAVRTAGRDSSRSPSPIRSIARELSRSPSPVRERVTPRNLRYRMDMETTPSPARRNNRSLSPARSTIDILQSSMRPSTAGSTVSEVIDAVDRLTDTVSRLSPYKSPLESPTRSPVSAARHIATCRPPCLLTSVELYDLLLEMGCSPYNAQIVKDLRLGGSEMLELDEDEMLLKLKLGSEVTRKLLTIQRANEMFERMTRTSMQGKISELELRMYLAAQGLRGAEVTLVADDFKDIPDGADGSVSFWEWAKSYDWFSAVMLRWGVDDVP